MRASTDPLVRQFVDGKADGPVRFHYPGATLEDDFRVAGRPGREMRP
jgi:phospholipid/cholesterol/gamma-HCH transport system ATP-binding protein